MWHRRYVTQPPLLPANESSPQPFVEPVSKRGNETKLDLTKVASWDGDRLVFHETAMAVLIRDRLSPSTSKSIGGGCGASWAGQRLMAEKFDPFTPANLGTSVHEIYEDLFKLPYWNRSRATALGLLEKAKAEMWPGNNEITVSKRAEWHGQIYHLMNGLWAIENPMLVQVHGVEMGFSESVLVGGVPFNGYVDRTDKTTAKDGTPGLAVVDYKTGKMPDANKIKRYGDDHGDQMRLYNEAYYQETGEKPVRASLYYTQFGKKKDAALSAPYMKKTLKDFEASWHTLKRYEAGAAYPTKVGPLCGWCPLVNTCPAAAAAGMEDRTGKALPAGAFRIPVMRPLRQEVAFSSIDHEIYDPYDDVAAPADAVHEVEPHAHIPSGDPSLSIQQNTEAYTGLDQTTSTSIGAQMSQLFSEDKSWQDESQGLLNANSYAATAMFANSSWAYDELNKANVPLSVEALEGLSRTFQYIVATVQQELGGSTLYSDGLNSRLRGALHSFMDHHPIPFGGSAETWTGWVEKAIKNVRSIALNAHKLYSEAPKPEPWLAVPGPRAAVAPVSALSATG